MIDEYENTDPGTWAPFAAFWVTIAVLVAVAVVAAVAS